MGMEKYQGFRMTSTPKDPDDEYAYDPKGYYADVRVDGEDLTIQLNGTWTPETFNEFVDAVHELWAGTVE